MKYASSILVAIAMIVAIQAFSITFWKTSDISQKTTVQIIRSRSTESQSSATILAPASSEWSGPRQSTSSPSEGNTEEPLVTYTREAPSTKPKTHKISESFKTLDASPRASTSPDDATKQSPRKSISQSNRDSRIPSQNRNFSFWSRQRVRGKSQPNTTNLGLGAVQSQQAERAKREAQPSRGNTPIPPVRGSMP